MAAYSALDPRCLSWSYRQPYAKGGKTFGIIVIRYPELKFDASSTYNRFFFFGLACILDDESIENFLSMAIGYQSNTKTSLVINGYIATEPKKHSALTVKNIIGCLACTFYAFFKLSISLVANQQAIYIFFE